MAFKIYHLFESSSEFKKKKKKKCYDVALLTCILILIGHVHVNHI